MSATTDPKDLTLERNGYLRCTFDFEEGEDCLGCNRVQPTGARQYYIRTCYEVDEGEYYCRRCAFARIHGREWDRRPYFKRARPWHGAGWAFLHGMKNWEDLLWGRFANADP